MKHNRTATVLCCVGAALLLLAVSLILAGNRPEEDSPTEIGGTAPPLLESVASEPPPEATTQTEATASAESAEETVPAATSDSSQASTQTKKPTSGKNTSSKTEVKTRNDELTCGAYSLFSGQFVEDGRDELVENVAAILVTNNTDRFLDLATLYFTIDGKDASFIVTGLPAGRSAWVMETTRLNATNSSEFIYLDCMSAFRDNVVAASDKISISADGNMLTATNKTDKTLENVCAYYRTVHTDGNFFGGITYLVDFGTLEPGQSVETLAGHYDGSKTEIVRIGWQTQ